MEKESDFENEFVRGLGLNPEDVLTEMHLLSPTESMRQIKKERMIRALSRAFMDNLKKELSLR